MEFVPEPTMTLPDLLPIQPFTRPVCGEAAVPGSKSLTNRALLLAALGNGPVTLTGALFSEDTKLMAEALRKLGFAIVEDSAHSTLQVKGLGGKIPAETAELFVGLAGTAARFLTALCAAAPQGVYRIDGVPQMRKRPMRGLLDALRQLGADIRCQEEEGFLPIEVLARGLRGGSVRIDASESSQMLSALLMVAPLAREGVEIELSQDVREPFVQMTTMFMARFGEVGIGKMAGGRRYRVEPGAYRSPATFAIEPDATAASYFLALPLVVGGTLHLPGLLVHNLNQTLQGDSRFAGILKKAGAQIAEGSGGVDVSFSPPAVRRGLDEGFREFSDTFLTLASIAPLLEGPTRITGIAHTRRQETDRVAGMARELRKLGQEVVEEADALTIAPRPLRPDQVIETYGDHRFAMSFAILGCHDLCADGRPWLTIRNPACCAKTFPQFFELLESLRQKSLAA
jgi:3-phosphoshikimate 1-carboxyvinyltransferase